jgi:hypothetical protein
MNPYPFCELNHFTVPRAIEGLQSRGACIAYGSSEIHAGTARYRPHARFFWADTFQMSEKLGSVIAELPAGRAEVPPITGGARVHGGQTAI